MPPLPPVPSVIKVEFIGTYQSNTWAIIHHFQYSGSAPTVAQLNTLGAQLATDFGNNLLSGQVSQHVSLLTVKLTDLSSNTGASTEVPVLEAGTNTSTDLPTNVAIGVSWSIAQRYRGGHPRSYLPGACSNMLASGSVSRLSGTFLGGLGTGAAGYIAAVNARTLGGSPIVFGSVNYFVYGAHPPALRSAGVFHAIIGSAVHPRLDSQRRRLGKETT